VEVSGQLHILAALPPGKEPLVPTGQEVGGGLRSQSGRGGEEKNSEPLSGLEPPLIQVVAQRYTTELSRLHMHSSNN
jgi:hypothetical protein